MKQKLERTIEDVESALKELRNTITVDEKIFLSVDLDPNQWTKLQWQMYYMGQAMALQWMITPKDGK